MTECRLNRIVRGRVPATAARSDSTEASSVTPRSRASRMLVEQGDANRAAEQAR